MKLLAYEKRLRKWAEGAGVEVERFSYPRPGGETCAFRWIPAGRPRGVVVVSHGAGNDALFGFVGLFRSLLEHGFEVFSFDLDGHGRFSTARLAAGKVASALPDAVRQSGVQGRGLPLHLIGVSLGGSILLHSLSRLPAASATVVAAPLHVDLSWRVVLRELGPASLRTLWRERKDYGVTGLIPAFGPLKRSIYPLRLDRERPGSLGYIEALNEILDALELESRAAAVNCPLLLLYGERDLTAPPDHGRRIRAASRTAELRILEGESHLSVALAPDAAASILHWVERHTPQSASRAANDQHGVKR